MKKSVFLCILFAILIAALVVAANIVRRQSVIKGLRTSMEYGTADTLVTASDIDTLLLAKMPMLPNMRIKDLNLSAIRDTLMLNPYVASCKTSVTAGGTLRLRIVQRQPVMRYYSENGCYYYDRHGKAMPYRDDLMADVPVASGHPDTANHGLHHALVLATFLTDNKQYTPLIDQIFIQTNGELLATPTIGKFVIEIGNADSLDAKFALINTFLHKGLPTTGWDRYEKISVKYGGQIVAKKR